MDDTTAYCDSAHLTTSKPLRRMYRFGKPTEGQCQCCPGKIPWYNADHEDVMEPWGKPLYHAQHDENCWERCSLIMVSRAARDCSARFIFRMHPSVRAMYAKYWLHCHETATLDEVFICTRGDSMRFIMNAGRMAGLETDQIAETLEHYGYEARQ